MRPLGLRLFAVLALLAVVGWGACAQMGPTSMGTATPVRDGVQALTGPPDATVRIEQMPGGLEAPSLTPEQTARAREILEADPRVKALLRGVGYTIEYAPVRDSASGSNEPMGITMMISPARPISIEGSWLMKHYNGPGEPPLEVPVHFPDCAAPNGVAKFFVVFFFKYDKLVQIEPLGVVGFDVGTNRYCRGGK